MKKDFKKKGRLLITGMIVSLIICPLVLNYNDVMYFVGGGRELNLPADHTWMKDSDEVNGHSYPRENDKVIMFQTTKPGWNLAYLQDTWATIPVSIKGNTLYDKNDEYVGKIRKKSNGDIVIYACTSGADVFNGTYKK